MQRILTFIVGVLLLTACKVNQPITVTTVNAPLEQLVQAPELINAHVGVYIADAQNNAPLQSYQSEKYFVPASNTKIISTYAALQLLPDTLIGMQYVELDTAIVLLPTGDPTFLHSDFPKQPVLDFLKAAKKPIYIDDRRWQTSPWGSGWSWNDYTGYYMAERSPMPIYGNVVIWKQEKNKMPDGNVEDAVYTTPEINWPVKLNTDTASKEFIIDRLRDKNEYTITFGATAGEEEVPFITNGLQSTIEFLKDSIGKNLIVAGPKEWKAIEGRSIQSIRSQSRNAMLKNFMWRSDNFYGEQILQMIGALHFNKMKEEVVIDSLLNSIYKQFPQKPYWADGSGLSRYNAFTPKDFVWILGQTKANFGMSTIQSIYATGNQGTLRNFYKADSLAIYAKTGTLGGVVALSGFLTAKSGRQLIFSVLVNNHRSSAVAIRRKVEAYLQAIRKEY